MLKGSLILLQHFIMSPISTISSQLTQYVAKNVKFQNHNSDLNQSELCKWDEKRGHHLCIPEPKKSGQKMAVNMLTDDEVTQNTRLAHYKVLLHDRGSFRT